MRSSFLIRLVCILLLGLSALGMPAHAQTVPAVQRPAGVYYVDAAVESAMQSGSMQSIPVLQTIGEWFNWFGGPGVIYLAILLWLGARLLRSRRTAELGLRGLEAIGLASLLGWVVKVVAGRARPYFTPGEPWHWELMHGWRDAHYFSMPSGHTATTFAFAAAVSIVALGFGRWPQRAIAVATIAAALLVAFARVYTHQHWFSDVIVATIFGTACGLLVVRWHARHPILRFDRVMLGAVKS